MMKQPKYFISKIKENKASLPIASNEPVLVPEAAPKISQFLPIRQFIHPTVTRVGVFALGASTLVALVFLVAFNAGIVKASLFQQNLPLIFQQPAQSGVLVTQPKSTFGQGLNFDIETADARIEIVRSFLERYKSPLEPREQYAKALVESADRYGLDYRLLPAIMMQESNLCKSSDPKLHNCLGFGIHERGTLGFDTYEEGFDRAARELKANYIDRGLVTPEQIMKKYTPSSNGSWAHSVNQWIAEMEHNDRQKGLDNESDASLLEYTASKQ